MLRFIGRLIGSIFVLLGLSTVATADFTVGDAAPEFRLQDQKGEWHSLDQYLGQWVVIYFYPKDDTPGCTKEACAFRDNIFAFEEAGAVILGISLDDVASHEAFAEKYSLPFSLLSDASADTARDYGVLKTMGSFKFAQRQSFIVDADGNIAMHYDEVNAEKHSEQVLADLEKLMQPSG